MHWRGIGMTDYFRCSSCGAIVKAEYNKWPTCDCRDDDYSFRMNDDFERATEGEYYGWIEERKGY